MTTKRPPERAAFRLRQIAVDRIQPEDGLGRKRDREGHRDLCRWIEQFGVLHFQSPSGGTPDRSGEYLLIKGQGRTLACRILGISKIPAVVVSNELAETEKVQQFLVENVARLRMRPIDRALLIAHARKEGEETAEVAKRFGVSPSTVRRLELQLDGATSGEVTALRDHDLNLSLHAVIARNVTPKDRAAVIRSIGGTGIHARELEELFAAIGWHALVELGPKYRARRMQLLAWAAMTLASLPRGNPRERMQHLALQLPADLHLSERFRRSSTSEVHRACSRAT